jgi:membrane-associated protease RseP (regulator of RpoE activity)
MLNLIYFIIILGVIVLVHEFGHFIFAKMFGIYVYEFAIGMGPKLFHFKSKKGETDTGISGTPTVLFYNDGVEKTVSSRINGSVSVDKIISKFKANNFLDE